MRKDTSVMKSRFLAAIVCVIVVGLLALPTAWAAVRVARLYMSTASGGAEVTEFASDVQEVFAIFEYSGASNERLDVVVTDGLGTEVFLNSETYNGSAVKSIAITGEKVFESYKSAATTGGQTLLSQIELAQNSSTPSIAQVRLSTAISAGEGLKNVITSLRRYPASAEVAGQLEQSANLLNQALTKGRQLINVQQTPPDQMIAAIPEMLTPAQGAVDSLNMALSGLGSGQGKALLGGSYLTQVRVREGDSYSSPAASAEWTVAQSATPTPSATSTTPPSGSAAASATPTQASVQAAASATSTHTTPSTPVATATRLPNLTPQTTPPASTLAPTALRPMASPTAIGGRTPVVTSTIVAVSGTATGAPAPRTTGSAPGTTALPTSKAPASAPTAVAGAQTSSGLPVGMLGLVGGALLLGLLALWVRGKF